MYVAFTLKARLFLSAKGKLYPVILKVKMMLIILLHEKI